MCWFCNLLQKKENSWDRGLSEGKLLIEQARLRKKEMLLKQNEEARVCLAVVRLSLLIPRRMNLVLRKCHGCSLGRWRFKVICFCKSARPKFHSRGIYTRAEARGRGSAQGRRSRERAVPETLQLGRLFWVCSIKLFVNSSRS